MNRWRRRALAALAVIIVIFGAATVRLMIWPARGMPEHVAAIVMLSGPGERMPTAIRLAHEHRASFLVVSRGHEGYGNPCPAPIPDVRLICFEPVPASTRGEAEFVGQLARRNHWHSLALITSVPQDSRARERVAACFPGRVYVVPVGLPWTAWPGAIAYEWGATIKMYLFQPGC